MSDVRAVGPRRNGPRYRCDIELTFTDERGRDGFEAKARWLHPRASTTEIGYAWEWAKNCERRFPGRGSPAESIALRCLEPSGFNVRQANRIFDLCCFRVVTSAWWTYPMRRWIRRVS